MFYGHILITEKQRKRQTETIARNNIVGNHFAYEISTIYQEIFAQFYVSLNFHLILTNSLNVQQMLSLSS